MDLLIYWGGWIALGSSCFVQYKIACKRKRYCIILPALYGGSMFVFGLSSVMFAFILIFIAEITYSFQEDTKGKTR